MGTLDPNPSVTDSMQASFVKNFNPNSTISSIPPKALQLLEIEFLVLVMPFSLLMLFLLGCLRRRVQSTWLKLVTNALYTLMPITIPYVIGLMQVSPFVYDLFPIWALFLVFVYGGVDTLTAFNHRDNDKKVAYWLHTLLLWFWCAVFVWYSLTNGMSKACYYPVLVLFVLTQFNIHETMEAFKAASKTDGLQQVLEDPIKYVNLTSSQQNGYLIDVVHGSKKLITTQEMSKCPLLSNKEEDRAQALKDMCLSFAFHKILLMKFARLSLPESFIRKAKDFAEVELLTLEHKQVERVFHIIEVELEFVFEFFYTKFYILSKKNPIHKLKRLLGAALCVWFAFVTLHKNPRLGTSPSDLKVYGGLRLAVGVTRVVMLIFAALECLQFIMAIFSNWTIVRLLCSYANTSLGSSNWTSWLLENVISLIWGTNDWLSRTKVVSFFVKPWKRKLGQYSLLESFDRSSVRQLVLESVGLPKVLSARQKGASSVTLSEQVKTAIVTFLTKEKSIVLTPGIASLHRNGMGGLSNRYKYSTSTQVILVWHIATAFYEVHSSQDIHKNDKDNFRVATELSKYCAYLVAFSCELVPDDLYVVPKVFKGAIEDTKRTFDGKERHTWMKSMTEKDCKGACKEDCKEDCKGDCSSVVRDGFMLAKELMDIVKHKGEGEGWKVLAEFWSELLLFLAPSDNATMHIEHLAQGGEFITHLWALLTHVGVVSRKPYGDNLV